MRRLMVMVAALAGVMAVAAGMAASAGAYGGGASHEMWQIGLSENCTNPTPGACDAFGGTGGQWGWGEFDRQGGLTWGDAQVTFCGHEAGFGGGAGHVAIDVHSWYPGPNGDFWVTGETDTLTGPFGSGHGGPVTQTFDPENSDTGIPMAPGHYHTSDLLGFSAPGLSFNIQVTYRSAK